MVYEEYACGRLDPLALSHALNQLMCRHEMLRSTFDASGTMRVHNELPVPLAYESLRGLPEEICRRRLAESRDEWYSTGTCLLNAAPFAIRVFALDGQSIVQWASRLLAIDHVSAEIFARELRALLAGEALPALNYTFRNYLYEAESQKESAGYTAARSYWLDRLDLLPPAPQLPVKAKPGSPGTQLARRVFTLPAGRWAAFSEMAAKHNLSPAVAVGAVFSEVLRHWARRPDFTINFVYGEREPAHPDVPSVIGNFSNSLLLECAPNRTARTFLDRACAWGEQLSQDLAQSAFSGLSAIRELKQRKGDVREEPMPVMFTGTLDEGPRDNDSFLGHLGWQRLETFVRTPHVSLNHHMSLAGQQLITKWDSADELFPPGLIDDMFEAYQNIMTKLSTRAAAWHSESFGLPSLSPGRVILNELPVTISEREEQPARGGLVRLGGADYGDPLVLVHPAGGDLQFHRHMVSAVESRHAVYGLSGMERRTGSVEEMADHYLTEVLSVSQDRPIRLAGWSLGGVIAYEMGRRLYREDRKCTVVMIDPWVGRKGGKQPCEATLIKAFLYHLAESEVDLAELGIHAQEPPLEVLQRIWSNARDDLAVLKSLRFDELSAMYRLFKRHTRALLRYAVTVEPGLPVQIIEAQERLAGPVVGYLSPLLETVPGFAAPLSLPGNHFTLLDMRTARKVADLL
jgi:thioesterase domain-containing protein